MFVANRVTEIQNATPPSCWHHCSSKDNPADLISRGVLADQIVNNQEERIYKCYTEEEVGVCKLPVYFIVNPSLPLFDLSR